MHEIERTLNLNHYKWDTRLSGSPTLSRQPLIIGASPSLTVTEKLQSLLLPLVSVAVQVTVVLPLVKVDPLAGLQTTDARAQLSLAVGAG